MSALAPSPPSAASKETGEKSAPLNPLHFRELARTQQICNAARQPANLAALEDCGINQSFLDRLLDDVTLCRRKCIDALQHITVMANHCRQATESKRALLAALAEVEAAAKRKYARSARAALRDFCVGQNLGSRQAALEQFSQRLVERLMGTPSVAAEALPGVTPEKVSAIGSLRSGWMSARAAQGAAQTQAASLQAERDTLLHAIAERRLKIQSAAEAAWPSDDPANAETRRAFLLQPARPFKVAA